MVLTRGHKITHSTTDLLIGICFFIITGALQWVVTCTYMYDRQNGEAGVNFSHGCGWRNPTAYTESAPSDRESPTEHFMEHTDDENQDKDWKSGVEEEDTDNSSGSDSESDSEESLFNAGCDFEFDDL